jgi:transglutaminase-like putative cysteine protease
VKRQEVRGKSQGPPVTKEEIDLFLKPDRKVPIGGKPATLLEGKKLPADRMGLAKLLYDVVNGHMQYSKKGTGWGQGDAVWACDSRYGNCTDFHSLFIALARTNKLPARFEIGFALPPERGAGQIAGYHCWAQFSPDGKSWIPVDISQANQLADKDPKMVGYLFGNLTEDRVAFSVGRDLTLVPAQAGPPLNFFIYPYVEVEGKPYPADRIRGNFSYKDVN